MKRDQAPKCDLRGGKAPPPTPLRLKSACVSFLYCSSSYSGALGKTDQGLLGFPVCLDQGGLLKHDSPERVPWVIQRPGQNPRGAPQQYCLPGRGGPPGSAPDVFPVCLEQGGLLKPDPPERAPWVIQWPGRVPGGLPGLSRCLPRRKGPPGSVSAVFTVCHEQGGLMQPGPPG